MASNIVYTIVNNMTLLIIFLLSCAILIAGVFIGRKIFTKISHLSSQNRLLRALRSLDVVALSATEIESLAQAIVNVIHKELGYTFAIIALVDYEARLIRRVAISLDPNSSDMLQSIVPVQFKQQVVSFDNKANLFNKVIAEKKIVITENLYDIQIGVLPKETSDRITKTYDLKTIYLHPLFSRGNVVGILEYASTVKKDKISQLELTIMNAFTAEVTRAIENTTLYTKLRKISQDLQNANERLEELDKLKDDFVSVASHELRTPMTAIRSYAWMALHKSDVPLSAKLEKYLIRVLISTERLINLVNDMLNVSRIESGKIEIIPEPVDLLSLVKDIIDEVYYSKSQEKTIQFVVLEKPTPKVFADPEKLRQVFLNLVGNSLKFTPNGGKIIFDFFSDGKVVDTAIKDSGVGISKEDVGKLFQKFGRLDNSYVAIASSGGTGLGLFISKNLVELMHGRIWANSEGIGKGTTMTISLPVASPEVLAHADNFTIKPKGEVKGLEPVAI